MAAVLVHESIATPNRSTERHLSVVGGAARDTNARRAVIPSARTMRRRQAVAMVLVSLFVWVLVSAASTAVSYLTVDASSVGSSPVAHVVQPGDTVWSIARQHRPTGDIRLLVSQLVDTFGSDLVPGQVVTITP